MAVLRFLAVAACIMLQFVSARTLNGFSRKDLIEQFKLTPGDITEMAVAHGSTAEFLFVRPQKPTPFTTAEKVYDILKANPNPDFFAIIEIELAARLPKIEAKCNKCILDVALPTCKQAWNRAMNYCDYAAFDKKSKSACADWKKVPEHFIVNNILRAAVNPIDGGKRWCHWWKKIC